MIDRYNRPALSVLRAKTISASYPKTGGRLVVKGLSLDLVAGSILAIIGPNGSGKTSLFKALTGELPLSSGIVEIECPDSNPPTPRKIQSLSPRERARRITRVLQSEQAAWPIRVDEYVETGLFAAEGWFARASSSSRIKVEQSLDAVGIASLASRPVTELSGGEFRRVVIARALVQDTDILLLDEPTSDLDLANQMDTLRLLSELARKGKAIAFSVHDLNLASMVADDIILMIDGSIAAQGSPAEVLRSDIIARSYGTKVVVTNHPSKDIPQVIPDPDWLKRAGQPQEGNS
jgi:iron complex transport system ATP-binding protein